MASPLDQFEIKPIVSLGRIGNSEIAFTNSSLFMMLVVGAIGLFFMAATAQRAVVPGRMQALAEMLYEFVASTPRLRHPSAMTSQRASRTGSAARIAAALACVMTLADFGAGLAWAQGAQQRPPEAAPSGRPAMAPKSNRIVVR